MAIQRTEEEVKTGEADIAATEEPIDVVSLGVLIKGGNYIWFGWTETHRGRAVKTAKLQIKPNHTNTCRVGR